MKAIMKFLQFDPRFAVVNGITSDMVLRPASHFSFHFRSKNVSKKYIYISILQLPASSEGIKEWMYKLYYEKETMLEEFDKTGVFPHNKFARNGESSSKPRPLVHDPIRFFVLHVFFLTSSYVMLQAVMAFYSIVYAWAQSLPSRISQPFTRKFRLNSTEVVVDTLIQNNSEPKCVLEFKFVSDWLTTATS